MAFIEGIVDSYYEDISPYEYSIESFWQDDGFGNLINTWYDGSHDRACIFRLSEQLILRSY